jgi:hypothetical protein
MKSQLKGLGKLNHFSFGSKVNHHVDHHKDDHGDSHNKDAHHDSHHDDHHDDHHEITGEVDTSKVYFPLNQSVNISIVTYSKLNI